MRRIIVAILSLILAMSLCCALAEVPSGVEDGVLTVAMECN